VLELLELLKDDPDLFVRRSVANNLNDIGKDNPAALIETCRRWMKDASPQRSWSVRHALRSAVKRGEPEALEILGFLPATGVQVRDIHIAPAVASIGDSITFTVELSNDGSATKQLLIELRVHFVKANGKPSPKVFSLKELELRPNGSVQLSKTISLAQHTTRTHYPGQHRVEVLVNGRPSATSVFDIVAEGRIPTS
jgi:HEAT repeat protein